MVDDEENLRLSRCAEGLNSAWYDKSRTFAANMRELYKGLSQVIHFGLSENAASEGFAIGRYSQAGFQVWWGQFTAMSEISSILFIERIPAFRKLPDEDWFRAFEVDRESVENALGSPV